MKESNTHIQSKIGVSDKDPISIPISCYVDMGMLGEIERSGNHRSQHLISIRWYIKDEKNKMEFIFLSFQKKCLK